MKLLKVNMTTQSIVVEDVAEEYNGLGGRGLTLILINNEVVKYSYSRAFSRVKMALLCL